MQRFIPLQLFKPLRMQLLADIYIHAYTHTCIQSLILLRMQLLAGIYSYIHTHTYTRLHCIAYAAIGRYTHILNLYTHDIHIHNLYIHTHTHIQSLIALLTLLLAGIYVLQCVAVAGIYVYIHSRTCIVMLVAGIHIYVYTYT